MADKENNPEQAVNNTPLSEPIEKKLSEKFLLDDIEWVIVNAYDYNYGGERRVRAFAHPYIKKESAEKRADDVLGVGGWTTDFSMPDQEGRFKFKLSIKPPEGDDWIEKINGASINMDAKGGFKENAFETAITFAAKRAFAQIGIGRYLRLVPHREVQISTDFKEGWNYYRFRSNVDKGKYVSIYWKPPRLPESALHPEDSYPDETDNTDNNENSGRRIEDADPLEARPASETQWDKLQAYYQALPDEEKDRWYNYLYEDEVDNETAEVTKTRRRRLSAAGANNILESFQKGYGNLNNNMIPEKLAKPVSSSDMPAGNPADDEVRKAREAAQEKKSQSRCPKEN